MSCPLVSSTSSSPTNLPHSTDTAFTTTPAIAAPYTLTPSSATSTPTINTANFPTLTETRYLKDNSSHHYQQQHHHHPQPNHTASEASDMAFIPELLLSSLLQSQCNLPHSPIMIQPIHHTLENATITYDTLVEQQKQLVKDVFFSPAMASSVSSCEVSLATMSLSASPAAASITSSSLCSDDDNTTFCGSQTDGDLTRSLEDDFSPSDLLLDHNDSSLFFGALNFDLEQQQQQQQQQVSAYNTIPDALLETSSRLPHSPFVSKRKRQDAVLPRNKKQNSWSNATSPKSTPPMSPNQRGWNDFGVPRDDASDDDYEHHHDADSSSADYQIMNTDFQHISMQDNGDNDVSDSDNDSLSSWENRRATMFDSITTTTKGNIKTKKLTTILKSPLPKKSPNSTTTITVKKPRKQYKKLKLTPTPTCPPETHDHLKKVDPRPTCHPTLYQKLTKANVDWCRYCGTTEGVNWRPGPWGKRTLCNKHGCDYKGYGFACKLPRLDLTGYVHESLHHRDRPVLQFYCASCNRMESWATNVLVRCEGCYKAYHQKCYHGHEQVLDDAFVASDQPWYCDQVCRGNVDRRRVVVEISRKKLPLMCVPNKNQAQDSTSSPEHGLRFSLASRGARHGGQ